jgi:hypothetical protein
MFYLSCVSFGVLGIISFGKKFALPPMVKGKAYPRENTRGIEK